MKNFYKGIIFILSWTAGIYLLIQWEMNTFDYCAINECCSTTGSLWQRLIWNTTPLFYLIGLGIAIRIGTIKNEITKEDK